MTTNEAEERACCIWGAPRLVFIYARCDGGFDITLQAAKPARDVTVHTLDVNGHAVCHEECAALEEARTV